MKQLGYFSSIFVSVLLFSCGNSDNTPNEKHTIVASTPFEFASVIESIVDTVYVGFNHIEDLDGADVPKAELLAGISKLEEEINNAKTEINSIQPVGKNPRICIDAGNNCLDAAKNLLSLFKKSADLLSKPDSEWSDSEFEVFDKLFLKYNEALEYSIDGLYDASDRYLNSQIERP